MSGRELADLMAQLPAFKTVYDSCGPSNQAQIDGRITTAKGTDEIALRALGAMFNGASDDAPAIQALCATMPRGGIIRLPGLSVRIATPLLLDRSILLSGSAFLTSARGTSLICAVPDAIQFIGAAGGGSKTRTLRAWEMPNRQVI